MGIATGCLDQRLSHCCPRPGIRLVTLTGEEPTGSPQPSQKNKTRVKKGVKSDVGFESIVT